MRKPTIIKAILARPFGLALVAFGLLLWARFIIVTGHPRTAVAVPVQQETRQHVQASEPTIDQR